MGIAARAVRSYARRRRRSSGERAQDPCSPGVPPPPPPAMLSLHQAHTSSPSARQPSLFALVHRLSAKIQELPGDFAFRPPLGALPPPN